MMGVWVPKEYGGGGGGVMELCLVVEELSKKCGGLRRHILEFIGDDVDCAGKTAKRCFVIVGGACPGVHHIEST